MTYESVPLEMRRKCKTNSLFKDSARDWLEEIPDKWRILPIKRLAKIRYGLSQPPSELADGLPLIRATNIKSGKILEKDMLYIDPSTIPLSREAILSAGDIIVVRSGAYVGDSSIIPKEYDGSIAGYDIVLSIINNISPFFSWQLLSPHIRNLQFGFHTLRAAQPHLNAEQLGSTLVSVPPIKEQRGIAAFLDHETTKIDALIAKKERLIELLQEKRAALISHAVTKGLDPSVPMKDSGVEWLGEIPAHWNSIRLKYVCSLIKDGTHQPPSRVLTGVPLLSVRNIVNGRFINLPDDSLISEQDFQEMKKHFLVLENDVLLAIVGATLGKVAIVEKMPPFYIQRSLAVFRPRPNKINFKFLSYFFRGNAFQQLIWKKINFSAQPGIYLGTLSMIHIAIPPYYEQEEIINLLDKNICKLDKIVLYIQTSIEKLKERRSALISAAVTGKIDVRDEVCLGGTA